jgi:hypothetical protein
MVIIFLYYKIFHGSDVNENAHVSSETRRTSDHTL